MDINNVHSISGSSIAGNVPVGNKMQAAAAPPFPELPVNAQKTPASRRVEQPAQDTINGASFAEFEKYGKVANGQSPQMVSFPAAYDKSGKGLNSFQSLVKEAGTNQETDLSPFISLII